MKAERIKSLMTAFVSLVLLVILDFVSKRLAIKYLANSEGKSFIEGILRLEYVENRGAAFGVLTGRLLPIVILTPVIIGVVVFLYIRSLESKKFRVLRVLCILFLAGSIGNFIDRVAYGFVVDFLEIQFFEFPIFNVADIYLTVSTIVLVILILFYYKEADWEMMKIKKEAYYDAKNQDNNIG